MVRTLRKLLSSGYAPPFLDPWSLRTEFGCAVRAVRPDWVCRLRSPTSDDLEHISHDGGWQALGQFHAVQATGPPAPIIASVPLLSATPADVTQERDRPGKARLFRCPVWAALVLLLATQAALLRSQPIGLRVVSVIDARSQKAISGADVLVPAHNLQWKTDSNGIATLTLPTGNYRILVRRLGFVPEDFTLAVTRADTISLTRQLEPSIPTLPALSVEAERTRIADVLTRNGFFERRKASPAPRSAFWSIDDITRLRILTWSQLASRVGGARSMGRDDLALRCGRPLVVVDGVPQRGRALRDIPLLDIAGVEFYSSAAQVPVQYSRTAPSNSPSGCVALVWMR